MQTKRLPQIILAASLSGVYLASLARGLTWANNGADGGDLITAAATGGVAHPSGYPVYLLLARLFQFIPVGSLAFRTNLMSALFAVCAALIVYEIVHASHHWLASLASAYALGLSPLFWSQAVIAEVYTLHILFIAALLYLSEKNSQRFLFGVIFGLGMGNHITIIFLLPLLFHKEKKVLLRRFAGIALGSLVYLALPLRAMSNPPVNWGDPTTFENFIWLVAGKLYQGQFFALTSAALWGQVKTTAALFLDQFGAVGLLVGFTGLVARDKLPRLHRNMLWIASAFLIFPLAYNTRDSFLYLLPSILCFSIWIGFGLGVLMERAAPRFSHQKILIFGFLLLFMLFIQAGAHWAQVDASHDNRAENFGRDAMAQIPKNAIVFAKNDEVVFALWYFHYALHNRPDIVVIAADLLQNKWYQETIRNAYPNLTLPDFFMFSEVVAAYNPDRIICYAGYNQSAQVNCPQP
ncbi:MAG: DUF2723 domain-containing protein [Anaerolineales bacterium]|nr:DUF2723 domain-containing protein [Anaerolineales bacterium]